MSDASPSDRATATHARWEDLPQEAVSARIGRRLVAGEHMMIAQIVLEEGALVPMHAHHNEQISQIVEGALRFWIGAADAEPIEVRAGEFVHIPPNVPHKALALERTVGVDVFSPPRQDWLDGTDAYLREG